MTATEIKTEIQRALEKIPEEALTDVLAYLKGIQLQSPENIKLTTHLRQILNEDKELLEKLAQ